MSAAFRAAGRHPAPEDGMRWKEEAFMTFEALRRSLVALLVAILVPLAAMAQTPTPAPAPPPGQTPAPAPQPAGQLLSAQELDALVSPIALYPDNLLSQVL